MASDCLFCRISAGQADTVFAYEDDRVVVFKDIHPQAPVHLLVVPKRHIRSINDVTDDDLGIVGHVIGVARDMAAQFGIAQSGYKLLFNVERGGGQVIFHLHLHIIGGWK